jgi:hypothetical protein
MSNKLVAGSRSVARSHNRDPPPRRPTGVVVETDDLPTAVTEAVRREHRNHHRSLNMARNAGKAMPF